MSLYSQCEISWSNGNLERPLEEDDKWSESNRVIVRKEGLTALKNITVFISVYGQVQYRAAVSSILRSWTLLYTEVVLFIRTAYDTELSKQHVTSTIWQHVTCTTWQHVTCTTWQHVKAVW